MKFDFSRPITAPDGTPVRRQLTIDSEPIAWPVGHMIADALYAPAQPNDLRLSGAAMITDLARRGDLADKIFQCPKALDLADGDVQYLKQAVSDAYGLSSRLIARRLLQFLDGKLPKPAENDNTSAE